MTGLEAAAVVSQREIAPAIWRLTLETDRIAAATRPGQFVHVRLPGEGVHLLRRPLSVYRADPEEGWLDLVYRVVGPGTAALAEVDDGVLDLIGPLGRGWDPPDGARALLVGGGLGAAPLFLLAQALGDAAELVLGARTAAELWFRRDFERSFGEERLCLATDDGTAGRAGLTPELAGERLAEGGFGYVAACGPEPMQRAVAAAAEAAGVPCQVSLERRMACGVGACLSCAVDTSGGKRRACVEGPVFDAQEVAW